MATIRIPLIATDPEALERKVSAQLAALPPGTKATVDRGEIWNRPSTGPAPIAIIYTEG